MVDEKYIALINQEIDGVNSPHETAALKEYFAAHAEARQFYDELAATANMLREVKDVAPSPNLKKGILRSIQPERYAVKERHRAWGGLGNLVHALFGAPSYQLKYAYVFALGLMAGLGIFALLNSGRQQQAAIANSDLSGTLAWREASEKFDLADSVAATLDAGHFSMQVKYSPGTVLAELSLNTSQEITAELDFEANDLGFSAISMLNNKVIPEMHVEANFVKLTNRGSNQYWVAFTDKTQIPTPLHFKLFSSGVLIYEKTLWTAKSHN